MRQIVWSQDALSEFNDIVAYIARDNLTAALKVADRTEEAISSLAAMPTGRRGRVAGAYEKVVSGLPYIIAYTLEPTPAGADDYLS